MHKIHSDNNELVTGFAETRIGGRKENQDSYGWQETKHGYVVTVCDGMGGGPGGKTASTIAVKEIVAGIAEAADDEDLANILRKAVRRANMAIIEAGEQKPALKGMGSTATVLLLNETSAFVAHVGDSRVYQFRGRKKIFRTFDHSVVFSLVAQGVITEEQARLAANSNVITRALGVNADLEVDVIELPYEKGDRFMLTTDGIHGTMPEKELVKLVTDRGRKLSAAINNIAVLVDDKGRTSGGGHDNLTIAIVETKTNSKLKPKMSKQIRLTLMAITALLVISIALNIVQCSSGTATPAAAPDYTDSLQALNDTVACQAEVINTQRRAISDIAEQVNGMTVPNLSPSVDSIKKIINKAK